MPPTALRPHHNILLPLVILICAAILVNPLKVNGQLCHAIQAYSPSGSPCDPNGFVLVFSDEFDGVALDQSKWQAITGVPRDLFTAPMWYQPENVEVDNGVLRLYTKNDPGVHTYVTDWATTPPTTTTRLFEYTSGEIDSRWTYGEGLYEISCKIPDGNGGFFPAFWLYGQSGSESNEVDIFEYWGNRWDQWHLNVHKHNSSMCPTTETTSSSATNYKQYKLQWDLQNIYWWRNDVGTVRNFARWHTLLGQPLSCTNIPYGAKLLNTDFPSHPPKPCSIIANVAINAGDVETTAVFPNYMEIDYIRYYRRVPCKGTALINNIPALLNSNGEYNFITGVNLTFSGATAWLGSGSQLDVQSTQSITLNPLCRVESGSVFYAHIGASNCGAPETNLNQISTHGEDFYSLAPSDYLSSNDGDQHNNVGLKNMSNSIDVLPTECNGRHFDARITDISGRTLRIMRGEDCSHLPMITSGLNTSGIILISISWDGGSPINYRSFINQE